MNPHRICEARLISTPNSVKGVSMFLSICNIRIRTFSPCPDQTWVLLEPPPNDGKIQPIVKLLIGNFGGFE